MGGLHGNSWRSGLWSAEDVSSRCFPPLGPLFFSFFFLIHKQLAEICKTTITTEERPQTYLMVAVVLVMAMVVMVAGNASSCAPLSVSRPP